MSSRDAALNLREIVDSIASQIESTSDLLSLACVRRDISVEVLKRHIRYRQIYVDSGKEDEWSDLAQHPQRTQNVRTLMVCLLGLERGATENPQVFAAIRHMQKLEKVHVFAISELGLRRPGLENYVRAFESLANITTFAIHASSLTVQDFAVLSQLSKLIEMTLNNNGGHGVWSAEGLSNLLSRNQHLEILRLQLSFAPNALPDPETYISECLEGVLLPCLRRFSIGLPIKASSPVVGSFLARHSSMSVLDLRSIAIGYNESIILPPNLLPHLTEVSCDDKTLVAILSSPVAHPRPITKIGGFSLMIFDCLKYFSSPNPRDLDIGGIEAIEKVSIPTKSRFMWMATLFPHLTSIHISFPTSKWLTNSEANRQWVEMLSNFPHLRVFHGHSFFRDPVNDDARSDNQDALTQLARIVPPVEEVAYPASKRMWERVLHLSREGRTITANLAITYEPSKYKILKQFAQCTLDRAPRNSCERQPKNN